MSDNIYTGKTMSFEMLRGGADSNYASWKGYVAICLRTVKAWSIISDEESPSKASGEDFETESSAFRYYERLL
jgi:hypothetical protein